MKGIHLFKWRAYPFPRRDNYEIAKIHWQILKISSSRTTVPNSTNLVQSILEWRGFNFVQMKDHTLLPRGDNWEEPKIHWQNFKKSSPEPMCQFQPTLTQSKHPWWRPFKFLQIRNHLILQKILFFSSPNQSFDINVCVYWFELLSQVSDVAHRLIIIYKINVKPFELDTKMHLNIWIRSNHPDRK